MPLTDHDTSNESRVKLTARRSDAQRLCKVLFTRNHSRVMTLSHLQVMTTHAKAWSRNLSHFLCTPLLECCSPLPVQLLFVRALSKLFMYWTSLNLNLSSSLYLISLICIIHNSLCQRALFNISRFETSPNVSLYLGMSSGFYFQFFSVNDN